MGCLLSLLDKKNLEPDIGMNYTYYRIFKTKEGVLYKYPITNLNNTLHYII